MNDLNFVSDGTIDRIIQPRSQRQHYLDIQREGFKRKLDMLDLDCTHAQQYCRTLIGSGADVSEELTELETTARGLLLVALILKREASNGKT